MTFSPRFKEKVDSVKEKHSQFTCQYGYSDSYGRRKLQGYSVVGEAMREIRKYCDHHNINIVELFARFDADGSMSVSHDEFTEGLKVSLRICDAHNIKLVYLYIHIIGLYDAMKQSMSI